MTPDKVPVAVVIPAYNRAHLIAESLESVAAQTSQPEEVIVVDDCSTDDTAEVAERLGARVIRHDHNQGAAAARNTGIGASSQPWIALLDSDDTWLPAHLATCWAAHDGYVLVAASALYSRDGRRRVLGPPSWSPVTLNSPEDLVYPENIVPASSSMFRRDVAVSVGGYDTRWSHAEDFDLWLRLLRRGPGRVLPDITAVYGDHPDQKSRVRERAASAQRGIAEAASRDLGVRPELVQRRLGVRRWDDLREAMRSGDRQTALRNAGAIVREPQRVLGVAGILAWRFRTRRRIASVDEQARPRVAVLPGGHIPTGSDSAIVDLRRASRGRIAATLVREPPRSAVGGGTFDHIFCRIAGVPHQREGEHGEGKTPR
jgi:GT2 family glycosyltransferase